jgi:hypothetical protein
MLPEPDFAAKDDEDEAIADFIAANVAAGLANEEDDVEAACGELGTFTIP